MLTVPLIRTCNIIVWERLVHPGWGWEGMSSVVGLQWVKQTLLFVLSAPFIDIAVLKFHAANAQ